MYVCMWRKSKNKRTFGPHLATVLLLPHYLWTFMWSAYFSVSLLETWTDYCRYIISSRYVTMCICQNTESDGICPMRFILSVQYSCWHRGRLQSKQISAGILIEQAHSLFDRRNLECICLFCPLIVLLTCLVCCFIRKSLNEKRRY